jgi:hypothetical protein
MAKKVIRLTESDIMGIVKNVINEMYECNNEIAEDNNADNEDEDDFLGVFTKYGDEVLNDLDLYNDDDEESHFNGGEDEDDEEFSDETVNDGEEEVDDLSSFEDSDDEGETEDDLYNKRYGGSAEDSWYVEPPKDEHKYDEDNEYTDGDVVYYENIPIEKKDGRFHMTIEDGFKGDNGDCPRIDVVGSHIADVKGEYDRLWNKFYYKDHYKYADQMVNSGKGQIQIDDTEPLGQGTRMGDYTVLVDLDKQ